MPSSSNRRYGFSLTQMMVTIAVIAAALGLILPAIQIARHAAVRTQCTNNLHNLALAYHNWKDANEPKKFATNSWVSELTRYVADVKTMFNCPLDESSWAMTNSEIYIRMYWTKNGQTYPLIIYDLNGGDRTSGENTENELLNAGIVKISKSELVGLRCRQSSGPYSVPLESPEGSWIAEFETTWATSNTGVGHASDWDDLFLLVEPQTNGTTKITYFAGDPHGGFGGNEIFDILDQNKNPVKSDVRPSDYGFIPGNGRGVSYGINSRAHDLARDLGNKVLLLEYADTIARVVRSNNPKDTFGADLSLYPVNVKVRHLGVFNVLYADGHVQVHAPDDIDPRNGRISQLAWDPWGLP